MSPRPYTSIPTVSPGTSDDSDRSSDTRDVDELDRRSRKLTKLLKKNINRTVTRKSILDNVRDKAWLLEDQTRLLEDQTSNLRNKLKQKSVRRKLVLGAIGLASMGSIYYLYSHNHETK